ncbi:hypothetical protein P4050_14480 [Pseudomonas aeruginosa]|nr:hypothetical protein [Pseudomonas aeruginosa]
MSISLQGGQLLGGLGRADLVQGILQAGHRLCTDSAAAFFAPAFRSVKVSVIAWLCCCAAEAMAVVLVSQASAISCASCWICWRKPSLCC